MKGIILAGGEGLKLRPMTSKLPKQMLSVCGRPLMEHMILLLKRYEISEIAVILGFLPREITEYFGDGKDFGVKITYFTDGEKNNNTAESLKEFLCGETAITIRGTVFCDFNFLNAYDIHRKKHADATVLLSKCENPQEFEQISIAHDGKLQHVWDKNEYIQTICDTVNTGIYLLEPCVFEDISKSPQFNFSKDLFSLMKENNRKVYGNVVNGYWCNVLDIHSYLKCMRDCLDEKAEFNPTAPVIRQGIRSWIPLKNTYKIYRPCYIGKNVVIENGAVIGPYAQISDNTIIEAGAVVQNSAVSGRIGSHSVLYGAIVCQDAVVGNGAGLSEGCVIGDSARIGEGAIIFENVRINSGKRIEAGAHVRFNLQQSETNDFSFSDIAPKYLMDLGSALASLGSVIALSHDGSSSACAVMGAVETGIRCMGSEAVLCDCRFASAAAFMSQLLKADFSVFINGDRKIDIFNRNGLYINSSIQNKIRRFIRNGSPDTCPTIGKVGTLTGADEIYEAFKIRNFPKDTKCMVYTHNSSGKSLYNVLKRSGVEVLEKRQFRDAVYELSDNGFRLYARDEKNNTVDFRHMLALGVLCALKRGEKRAILVYDDLPHALDANIQEWGGKIIDLNSNFDSDSNEISSCIAMDGIGCLIEILNFMTKEELTLAETLTALPDFHITEKEISLDIPKNELFSKLNHYTANINNLDKNGDNGLTVCLDGGWVVIRPSLFRRAVRIVSEGYSMEASEEICQKIEEKVKKINNKGRLIQ